MNSHLLVEFVYIIHLNKQDAHKNYKTSITRHGYTCLIQIYATRGISAWKSYYNTRLENFALMVPQSNKEIALIFFKAENLYFLRKITKNKFL